jgi:hypothetical protein
MRNVPGKKICTYNQNTHFMFSTFFFENRAFNEIMWKKKYFIAWQATGDNMTHAHCMLDSKGHTHTIIAFPPQQWLHEHCLFC